MIGRNHTDTITVKDVPAEQFVKAFAEHLKKTQKVTPLSNGYFIKTGVGKEVAPHSEDWFYMRAAAVARRLYLKPGLGVGNLRHQFGKNKRNGHRANKHSKGSGKVIRYTIQQLQDADVLMAYNDKRNTSVQGGLVEAPGLPRIVTPAGQKEMNEIAKQVFKSLYE